MKVYLRSKTPFNLTNFLTKIPIFRLMRFSCKKIFSIQNLLGYPVDLCFALYSILYLLCTIYIYGLQSGSCHATCAIIAIEYVHYYYYVGQQQRFDANKEDYYAKSRPLRILALKIPRCMLLHLFPLTHKFLLLYTYFHPSFPFLLL